MTDSADITADDDKAAGEHARWVTEIKLYEKEAEPWEAKGKTICRRYKDDRKDTDKNKARYNVLWSNVQTLQPALYARNPKADIERRNKKKDDLGRITAEVLERTTQYFVGEEEFGRVMKDAVLDRLLPGRGVAWVRYMPHFQDAEIMGGEEVADEGAQITDDEYAESEEETPQEIYFEEICFDYVHWQDYGHTIARTTAEVKAVWRKVYMGRDELVDRFGEIAEDVPLDYSPKGLNDEKIAEDMKKATVYEIWNKDNKKAMWLHKDHPKMLDSRDDPLGLKDFFPCPVPLLATTANDSLIPVPDYIEYQDQALELDRITGRITSITKSLKVVGIYDASAEAVQRILIEGVENTLIPVEQMAVMSEKGGLAGIMQLMPMMEIAQTLLALYEARDKVKGDLYEITGIADIIRGQSDPNETLGAQQLKGQFANMRLSAHQNEVQRFARDLVRIAAQIIAKHFTIETIKKISGVELLTQAEKAAIQQYQQMKEQQAQMQQQMQAQQQQPQPQGGMQ